MQSDNVINISIKEFLWSVLEQWKPVLLVGLAFAVIFPLVLAQKDKKAAADKLSAEAQYAGLSREELLDKLDDSSRQNVLTAAYQAGMISSLDNYNANSLLSHIDINNARTLHLKFIVTGADDASGLYSSYCALLKDSETAEAVRQGLGGSFSGVEDVYIIELITAETDGSSFDVYAYVPQGAGEAGMHEALVKRIEDAYVFLTGEVGKHDLTVVMDETVYTSDPELAGEIIERNYSLEMLRDTYRTELLTFSDLQMNILNSLISGEDAAVSSAETSQVTVFTPGRTVIGFVIGVFLYVFICLLAVLFSSKLQTGDQLNSSYGMRLLGKSSKYGYKGIKKFIYSKVVYNIHNKAYQGDGITGQVKDAVISSCRHNEISRLAVIAAGDISDMKRIEEFAGKLKKADGITVRLLSGDINDKDLENTDAAVLFVEQNVTDHKDIRKDLELCSVYGIPVIGGISLM